MATQRKQDDIKRLLASNCHQATINLNNQMKRYISHKGVNGIHYINIEETWQKIKLAARVIAAVQHPEDVMVVCSRIYGQRAAIKFAGYTNCKSTSSSRWTPGTLTNYQTLKYEEPRVIIVTDPRSDFQAIKEASYVNIPVIALCDSDSPLHYVDVVIPCNNRSTESISMIYWMIAREVKILRGELSKDEEWEVMVDLFYHKTLPTAEQKEAEEEEGVEGTEEKVAEVKEGEAEQNTDTKNW
ncbi:hypothetical protein ABPG72_003176 [Tetrahymena utriculariae]